MKTKNDTYKAESMMQAFHAGQKTLDGEPYFKHPLAVAKFAENEWIEIFGTGSSGIDDVICVAMLHDTAEDCGVTKADIMHEFTEDIADAVMLMTHSKGTPYLEYIKKIVAAKESYAGKLALIVKKADLTHNMDLTRLPAEMRKSDKTRLRMKKYAKAYSMIENAIDSIK
jgi:(p)ppGpp synthase/HD superfamily hydrolase